jgi:hypothetical protein
VDNMRAGDANHLRGRERVFRPVERRAELEILNTGSYFCKESDPNVILSSVQASGISSLRSAFQREYSQFAALR